MAFTKRQEQQEKVSFNRYIGVRDVQVVAINPTVEKLKEIYGGEPKPIEYHNEDGSFNVVVILKSADEDGSLYRKYFAISPEQVTSANGKIQVIDHYGRDVWVTLDEFENHKKPSWAVQYPETASIGISADYRPAIHGEVNLIHFIKAYLGIRDRIYDSTKQEMVDNEDMESRLCYFDNPTNIADGNLDELNAIFADSINSKATDIVQPTTLKVMLGVRISDGKLSNVIYPSVFLPWHARAGKDGKYYDFNQALKHDIQYAAEKGKPMDTKYQASDAVVYVSPNTQNVAETGNTMPEGSAPSSMNDTDDDLPF